MEEILKSNNAEYCYKFKNSELPSMIWKLASGILDGNHGIQIDNYVRIILEAKITAKFKYNSMENNR